VRLQELNNKDRLDRATLVSIFRVVMEKPVPADNDPIDRQTAIMLLAADLLHSELGESPLNLVVLKQIWETVGHADEPVLLHFVNDRYVGWATLGTLPALFDMQTGKDVPNEVEGPVIKSVAYSLAALLDHILAAGQGGRDADRHAARGSQEEGGGGLDQPAGVRDDLAPPVP
jgi:hypothetical protein